MKLIAILFECGPFCKEVHLSRFVDFVQHLEDIEFMEEMGNKIVATVTVNSVVYEMEMKKREAILAKKKKLAEAYMWN